MKNQFKRGQIFKDWQLISLLGKGGNGEVWMCENKDGRIGAIKLLKRIQRKSYYRFTDEILVVERNSDVKGMMPILDKYLPIFSVKETPFYVMPIAKQSQNMLHGKSVEQKVEAVIQIAETLNNLHKRGIYHRDIKPANILFYNERYLLADFGLVSYPQKKDVSHKHEEIGPKWTMAPEMRRASSTADAGKADIYSLAKTLWIYLTGENKGFDGQYASKSVIDLKKHYPRSYTSPIDNLLTLCTSNNPNQRPTAEEFITTLKSWCELTTNFHKQNLQQWFEVQTNLFPMAIPKRVVWNDVIDIKNILQLLCGFDNLNHVFLPNSGGLDLKGVNQSHEPECIELDFHSAYIVKPDRLLFESFDSDYQWNYFRLELKYLKPMQFEEIYNSNKAEGYTTYFEELSELSPTNYYPYSILADKRYHEKDYLSTPFSRLVTRVIKGSFVIFCKRSFYNLNPNTYDGRHNRLSTEEFREYIEENVKQYRLLEKRNSTTLKVDDVLSLSNKSYNHYVEEKTVFRCGWCGNIVDEDGVELDEPFRSYSIKVIEKYGHTVVERVEGNCCKDQNH